MANTLNGIDLFATVVEAGSFAQAAERLHLTRSAVGKGVARLELRLGVQLFHRTTRSQSLTEEGALFYRHCLRALEEVRLGEAALASNKLTLNGRLKVSMPVLFGQQCVAPILLALAKAHRALCFGIVNAVGSSVARASDTGIYTHVGPEIGVASTKAFTGQVMVLALFALALAKAKNTIEKKEFEEIVDELAIIPEKMKVVLQQNDRIAEIAKTYTYARNFLYMGRGFNYPVAMEGALKLKEISYIHAEGYPAAEMKHGPIALISQEMPVVVIAPSAGMYEKVVSNIQEIKARKGKIISVITEGDVVVKNLSDYSISIPDTEECLVPLLAAIPLQLMAYHIAVVKGCDVDQPRNLAKSVTVE